MKKFGAAYGGTDGAPVPGSGDAQTILVEGTPAIDRTYKLFYGGGQKRPDGNYCRPVKGPDGKVRVIFFRNLKILDFLKLDLRREILFLFKSLF